MFWLIMNTFGLITANAELPGYSATATSTGPHVQVSDIASVLRL